MQQAFSWSRLEDQRESEHFVEEQTEADMPAFQAPLGGTITAFNSTVYWKISTLFLFIVILLDLVTGFMPKPFQFSEKCRAFQSSDFGTPSNASTML
jgi:hypothetical protein